MTSRIILFSLALGLVFMSCKTQTESDLLQAELDTKKVAFSTLKLEISDLEEKLSKLNTNSNLNVGVSVTVEKAVTSHFEHFFSVNGSFESISSAYVSPETSGQVKSVLVKEGDLVKKDQLLVKLNTAITENNIREVKTALSLFTTIYEKQKELWDKKIGSEIEFLKAKNDMERTKNQLATLESQLDMSFIKSPINGVVDDIALKIGELAMPGQLIMHIVNLDEFYLNAEVSESYLAFLNKGDNVTVNLLAYGDKSVETKIYRLANIINPENRSFTVQMKMKNTDGSLKPNMLAEAKFMDYENPEAITVPSIFVKNDFNGSYLFIVEDKDGKTYSKKVYVTSTKTQGEMSMIDSGINAGDRIIFKGYNQVVDGGLISIK